MSGVRAWRAHAHTHTRQRCQSRDRRQRVSTNAAFLCRRGRRLCKGCAQAPAQSVGSHGRCSRPMHSSWLFQTSNHNSLNKHHKFNALISRLSRETRKLFNMNKVSVFTKKCTGKKSFREKRLCPRAEPQYEVKTSQRLHCKQDRGANNCFHHV